MSTRNNSRCILKMKVYDQACLIAQVNFAVSVKYKTINDDIVISVPSKITFADKYLKLC